MGDKAVTYVNGKMKKAGETSTVDFDGNINLGNDNADNIVFSGEVDSDIIPNDNNQYDLGSDTKRWAQLHAQEAYFEDYIIAELSIPGLDIQTDSNAYTFNCPYNMIFERLDADLDSSGSLTLTVTNLQDNQTVFSLTISNASSGGVDVTAANETADQGDRIRFAISAVSGSPQGLRANVRFRRR